MGPLPTMPVIANLRQAGGIPVQGGVIRDNVLFRSAAPFHIDQSLTDWMSAAGVGEIFDLRSESEASHFPGFPQTLNHSTRTRIPLLEAAIGNPADMPGLEEIYLTLVHEHGPVWVQIAEHVAHAERPTLVHCTAGKDRTGVAVALLLLAVGANRHAVFADYARSTDELSGAWFSLVTKNAKAQGITLGQRSRELLVGTTIAGLNTAIESIERQHGSVVGYLRYYGLSAADLRSLEQRLVSR